MSINKKNWVLALGYVGLIYSTLGIVGIPLGFLRSHGLLRISLGIFYSICFLWAMSILVRYSSTEKWRYAALCAVFGAYYAIAKHVQSPEEQIHFFQYGLVGILFYRAIETHLHHAVKTFLLALILAAAAGWLDEILQGLLPNRHYDIRDIFLNAVSAFLGLFVYRFVFPFQSKIFLK